MGSCSGSAVWVGMLTVLVLSEFSPGVFVVLLLPTVDPIVVSVLTGESAPVVSGIFGLLADGSATECEDGSIVVSVLTLSSMRGVPDGLPTLLSGLQPLAQTNESKNKTTKNFGLISCLNIN